MSQKIGADALLQSLKNHGVREMFAYPGGAVLPMYDRMPAYDIRRILVRNEQGAAFAAQGYSRASQNVGVCLATSGPGATNLVTGIADAKLDSVPMVAITGNVFKHLIGSDAFQETDIMGICEPIVKHSYFVTRPDDIPGAITEAFHLAISGRPGPVLVDITKCAQSDPVSPEVWRRLEAGEPFDMDLPGYTHEMGFNVSDADKAIELIAQAQKPLIIYGHGVSLAQAEAQLAEFIEKVQIPFTWTVHGIGAHDPISPLALGMIGMHGTGAANFAAHHADLILGIGIRFDDRITGKLDSFRSNKKFIHFDIDPSEFHKNVEAAAVLQGTLSRTLPPVTERAKAPDCGDWKALLRAKRDAWPLDRPQEGKLTEIAVIEALYEMMDKDGVVAVDVGQHQMWAAQRWPYGVPRKFLCSGGLGSMGFSLPSAMGAAFAGYETWSVSGDGGIQMNIQELGTIAQDQIPVKIVILNNSFLGMVRQWQELFYDKNYVDTPLVNPDFPAIAKAYGIPGLRATTQAETRDALRQMKESKGPILCEFVLEREENVFPMVPAGTSLGETLLSPTKSIDLL